MWSRLQEGEEGVTARLSLAHRRLLVGAVALAYALAFFPLYRGAGGAAAAANGIVVVAAGLLLGQRAGVLVGLGFIPIHLGLFALVGEREPVLPHVLGGCVFAVMGGTVGRLRDLSARLRESHARLEAVLAEVKEAQAVAAEREGQLELAQEVARMGSFLVNLRTGAPTWSPTLYRILGEDPAVPPSQERWWARIHPDDRPLMQSDFAKVGDWRPSFQREFRVVRRDGTVRWVYGRGQVELDADGRPSKMLGTVQDLTEHRAMQEQLASAERMAAVGTLARGMAHEINNPLSYLVTNLRFLARELAALTPILPPERAAELTSAAGEALHGADRVGAIVRDLMVFTRPEVRGGAVHLERIIDVAIALTGRDLARHARVVKDYAGVPQVQGDAWQLEQAFRDLLLNAALAIPPGAPTQHEIKVVTRHAGPDRVAVEVRDTGVGMAPEVLRRVFEPFFTTRPEAGKGMGLSTCLGIVRAAGGEIAVESEPGRGSAFTVTLPVAAPPPAPPGERPDEA